MYDFNFPKVTINETPKEAFAKIEEEVREYGLRANLCSFMCGDKFDVLDCGAVIEMLDVIHAAETMLRFYDKELVDYAHAKVVEKNAERGYYKSELDILVSGECREDCPWLNNETNACDRRAREVNDGQ